MNTETKYSIVPITKTTVKVVEKFSITLSNFKLFQSVDIMVICYSADDEFIECLQLTLDGSNGYNDWLNDDQFLITWTRNAMNFTAPV